MHDKIETHLLASFFLTLQIFNKIIGLVYYFATPCLFDRRLNAEHVPSLDSIVRLMYHHLLVVVLCQT